MSWKEQLQSASFRGVDFLFESADGELGRRIVLHEYPGRDLPYAEDLGRKARRWTLEAYVLGADYMRGRDALIRAIEQAGPGSLVHPYLGPLQVVVVEARGPRESTREGGMARFSLTFAEAGDNQYPAAATDTAALVDGSADAAQTAIAADFAGSFAVVNRPEAVTDSALSLSGRALKAIDAASRKLPAVPAQVAAFESDWAKVSGAITTLIRQPAELALSLTRLTGNLGSLAGLVRQPLRALAVYRGLFDFGKTEKPVQQATATGRRQARNQQALIALVRRGAVVEAGRAAATQEYDSIEQAVAVRDALAERLDSEMDVAADPVYEALLDLRVALVRDLSNRPELSRLVRIVPPATLPALVLAYQLYGDAGRAEDIVRRNRLRHPGAVPGGQPLEVTSA